MGGKKEKVHLSTYDTNVIQLGNTNNKMATPAPVQLQLPLTVSGLVFLCICLCSCLTRPTSYFPNACYSMATHLNALLHRNVSIKFAFYVENKLFIGMQQHFTYFLVQTEVACYAGLFITNTNGKKDEIKLPPTNFPRTLLIYNFVLIISLSIFTFVHCGLQCTYQSNK